MIAHFSEKDKTFIKENSNELTITELSHRLGFPGNAIRYFIRKNGLPFNRVYPAQRIKKEHVNDMTFFRVEERENWIV